MLIIISLPLLFIVGLLIRTLYLTWINQTIIDYQEILEKKYNKKHLSTLAVFLFIITLTGFFEYSTIGSLLAAGIAIYLTSFYLIFLNSRKPEINQGVEALAKFGLPLATGSFMIAVMANNMADGTDPILAQVLALTLVGIFIASLAKIPVNLIFSLIYGNSRTRSQNLAQADVRSNKQKLSKDMKSHYQDHGLSSQEIDYFRQQMGTARQQILSLETNFSKTAKLRAIETRHNTVRVCQTFFSDIVEEPQRLTETSQFLYKLLPNLEDLVLKYNEINSHVAKNKQTYQILDKTAFTIDKVCQQITDDYLLFHQATFNELEDELNLAQKNLKEHIKADFGDTESIVDQLIQEDLEGDQE